MGKISNNPVELGNLQRADKKIDVSKAIELHIVTGLSYAAIGRIFGVSKQAVRTAIVKFKKILKPQTEIDTYVKHKEGILNSTEMEMILDINCPEKRQKSTVGNAAYALMQVNKVKQLHTNQPTEIVDARVLIGSVDAAIREAREAIKANADDIVDLGEGSDGEYSVEDDPDK